ncbi:MAG: M48 family metalloprotease [Candidatus Eremiobacteraeota bacterium]|nr:M48 family metalloprotease [Candidatus Eremiobacteraeota bacterium]
MKKLGVILGLLAVLQGSAIPAMALSTSQEVSQGRAENTQIDDNSVVVQDPFLTAWVERIGDTLSQYRQRRDIAYRFTVLGTPDINAFAIKGGFVHVDMGLLNFVASDDELASTMAHEMGHVELRHVVKSSNQSTIIGILTALASILSPVAYVLGGIGSELAANKFSRADELQADHYGLRLMARAGFDPHAAVDVMSKLGAMNPGPQSRADKAFIDHPVPSDRVAHLMGYPELDKPTDSSLATQALHDQNEGRYSYAAAVLNEVPASRAGALVAQHRAQLDYALRESGALAAPDGRVGLGLAAVNDPRRTAAVSALQTGLNAATMALNDIKVADRTGQAEFDNLVQQVNKLGPQLQAMPRGPRVTNSAGIATPVSHLTRDITGSLDLLADTMSSAPGLIGPNTDVLREMVGPLTEPAPLTPKYQALLAYYPSLISSVQDSTRALNDSVQASRDAIAQALIAVEISKNTLGPPPGPANGNDRPNAMSTQPPPVDARAAISAWDKVYTAAQHATDMMYAAQTAGLSAEITLLDVLSSPERYAAYRQALIYRFPGQQPPTYSQAVKLGIPPGDLACAAWLAVDTHSPTSAVLAEMKQSGQSCEQLALSHHLLAESMEIAVGLVYENYIDHPQAVKR